MDDRDGDDRQPLRCQARRVSASAKRWLARPSAIVGAVAGVLLLVALGSLGDTPDTRDSSAQVASWFVDHRVDVFTSTILMTIAVCALVWFVAVIAGDLDPVRRV